MIAVGSALYVLHRLALWMEGRGWIYYKESGSRGGTATNAFLTLQAILEPSKQHVLEERLRHADEIEAEESGDPPARR